MATMTDPTSTDFSSLKLRPELLPNLTSLGYDVMTPIQAQSLPAVLAGRDVIAQAKTGSGKTAAFGLGILSRIDVDQFRIQSLVLCPTRELAEQVATEIRRLARTIHNIKVLTLCGGKPVGPQLISLKHRAHVVVGTPGRVADHLRRETLKLEHCEVFVLDEADRMLDMGFQEVLEFIFDHFQERCQTLLFSATFPPQILDIAGRIMNRPVQVEVDSTHDENSIRQEFYAVNSDDHRRLALRLLLQKHNPESALVFCNTKKDAHELACSLRAEGVSVLALHGDLEQYERDETLARFSNKSVRVLVATDVAARGLDIDALDAVFNFHIARESEVHVHRIGRTGRAGARGIACSLVGPKEGRKIQRLSTHFGHDLQMTPLPSRAALDPVQSQPSVVTLEIAGGKKHKIRPGDILGALTGLGGIEGTKVGKINILANTSYVAIAREATQTALAKLADGKLKGRRFRVRLLE